MLAFMVKPNTGNFGIQVCVQQTRTPSFHYCTWKFILEFSVLQYRIHTSEHANVLLLNKNWEGDISYRIGHHRVLHM